MTALVSEGAAALHGQPATSAATAAAALGPLVAAHREEAEASFGITEAVLAAAGEAGMFRLLAPREVGGDERTLPEVMAAVEELACADVTVAWHAGNSLMAGLAAAWLSTEAGREVFADGARPFGFSAIPGRATRVDGGYLLSGEWALVTGCTVASWLVLLGVVRKPPEERVPGQGPEVRFFLVPASQVAIEHTWRAAGAMQGTGSHAVSVAELFVPDAFAVDLAAPRLVDRPTYRIPVQVWSLGSATAAVLGVLRAGLDAAVATSSAKRSRIGGTAWRDLTSVRQAVAEASATTALLRAGFATVLERLQEAAVAPEVPLAARADVYACVFRTVDLAREAISRVYAAASSEAFAAGHPVDRACRDIHAVAIALERFRDLQADAGAVLLGGAPGNPQF